MGRYGKKNGQSPGGDWPFWVWGGWNWVSEGFFFEFFDLFDGYLEGFDGFGDFVFVQHRAFGEVDGDVGVDVCACDTVEFFQGHTGLFVVLSSSGAGDGENVGGLRDDDLFFPEGDKAEAFLLECFHGGVLVQLLAVFHEDGGPEAGEEDGFDAWL